MIVTLFIAVALALIGWWAVWTVRIFASVARNLWQAALGVGTIVRSLYRALTPQRNLLGEFLAKRAQERVR
jgi:hypothetical protein